MSKTPHRHSLSNRQPGRPADTIEFAFGTLRMLTRNGRYTDAYEIGLNLWWDLSSDQKTLLIADYCELVDEMEKHNALPDLVLAESLLHQALMTNRWDYAARAGRIVQHRLFEQDLNRALGLGRTLLDLPEIHGLSAIRIAVTTGSAALRLNLIELAYNQYAIAERYHFRELGNTSREGVPGIVDFPHVEFRHVTLNPK